MAKLLVLCSALVSRIFFYSTGTDSNLLTTHIDIIDDLHACFCLSCRCRNQNQSEVEGGQVEWLRMDITTQNQYRRLHHKETTA